MSSTEKALSVQISDEVCACNSSTLEARISQLKGVKSCEFNFTTNRLRVFGDVPQEVLVARLLELGYEIKQPSSSAYDAVETGVPGNFFQFMWKRAETRLAVLGAFLILPGLIWGELLKMGHPLIDLASMGALVAAGLPIARSAWTSLKVNREININVLMSVASIGAVIIGAYTEGGMVMVLFAIGEALESYTTMRARRSIQNLLQVVPDRATVLRQHGESLHETRVKVDALQVGDLIRVKPGERIPMDGRVLAGMSSVNQSPITGEQRLVDKVAGSMVYAGSINGEGSLEIEVTHLASENTISRMIKLVEEAQERRAPFQRFVDRFAKIYTPAVVGLALFVAIVPPIFFGEPFFNSAPGAFGWFYRSLALLVVACPCALVISTPVSIVSAISNAARSGILIKGGVYLEALGKVRALAFDKTGTVTEGHPSVVAAQSVHCDEPASDLSPIETHMTRCEDCDDLIALASAVEQHSEHPLARALLRESVRRGVSDKYPAAQGVTAMPGRGITGHVNGDEIAIGSHTYFDDAIPHPELHCATANTYAANGQTPIMVSADGRYRGVIAVADTVRQSSREAISLLKRGGLKKMVMLTGDSEAAALKVAGQIGLTDLEAGLMPGEKVSAVRKLQREYGAVAMVGDGINDTPALAAADVGIAIGGALGGTAQAMETADITLMSEDLRQLPFLFRLSRATLHTIKVNVALSLGVKLAFLGLVLLGLGTMWMAVLADMGTSLLVTLNGMRLLRKPSREMVEL
jgi:Cd2+/Zn2+-exporting ATPase